MEKILTMTSLESTIVIVHAQNGFDDVTLLLIDAVGLKCNSLLEIELLYGKKVILDIDTLYSKHFLYVKNPAFCA